MKNVFVALLAMVLALTMCLGVFAAPENFISSPSSEPAPEVVDSDNEDDDCPATVEVTPYSERDELDKERRDDIDDAYRSLITAEDLTDIVDGLKDRADDADIPTKDLSISDLFDIGYENCDSHDDHGAFDIVLKPEALENFLALMRYEDGKWVIIEDARVENGEHLVFTLDEFGPMAIVVDSNPGRFDSPQTGDNANIAIYIIMIIASAAALYVLCRRLGKEKSN